MTDSQKQNLCSFSRAFAVFAAGVITTTFATALTIGSEREEFKSAVVRSVENRNEIRVIQLKTAEDRIITKHIVDMLNEVRRDVRYLRDNKNTPTTEK